MNMPEATKWDDDQRELLMSWGHTWVQGLGDTDDERVAAEFGGFAGIKSSLEWQETEARDVVDETRAGRNWAGAGVIGATGVTTAAFATCVATDITQAFAHAIHDHPAHGLSFALAAGGSAALLSIALNAVPAVNFYVQQKKYRAAEQRQESLLAQVKEFPYMVQAVTALRSGDVKALQGYEDEVAFLLQQNELEGYEDESIFPSQGNEQQERGVSLSQACAEFCLAQNAQRQRAIKRAMKDESDGDIAEEADLDPALSQNAWHNGVPIWHMWP